MALSDEDVREILRIIDESRLDELRIESEGLRLHVLRGGAAVTPPPVAPESVGATAPAAEPQAPADPAPPIAADAAESGEEVGAPMLGIFYRAQGPAEEPFVAVGDRVEPDTVIGLIEVMKLMNAVQAGLSGTVVEVCAENGALVEFEQPLIRVAAER